MQKRSFIFLIVLFAAPVLWAQTSAKQQGNLSKEGVAIQGYDPVSYFKTGKAVKGSNSQQVFFNGATYYFSSGENKDAFKANPGKYEPQYGGWCAYAMGATGEKVDIDPETFKILDGKLFLFYNKYFNNTLKSWNKDEANLHAKADMNWNKLLTKTK